MTDSMGEAMHYSEVPDRELDEPYLDHGVEIIDAGDWDAPLVRCDECHLVTWAAGRHSWDDGCGSPHYRHDDIDPVCGACESEDITVLPAGAGPCQCCEHAQAMAGDDWCYSCAVNQELDDCRVMARTQRAVGDWERTVREITLAQAGVR